MDDEKIKIEISAPGKGDRTGNTLDREFQFLTSLWGISFPLWIIFGAMTTHGYMIPIFCFSLCVFIPTMFVLYSRHCRMVGSGRSSGSDSADSLVSLRKRIEVLESMATGGCPEEVPEAFRTSEEKKRARSTRSEWVP